MNITVMLTRSHRNNEFKREPQVEMHSDGNDLWCVAARMNYFKQLKGTLEAKRSQGATIKYRNDLAECSMGVVKEHKAPSARPRHL